MGTNYHFVPTPCPHCGRGDEHLHMSKSLITWEALLEWVPDDDHPAGGEQRVVIGSVLEWEAYVRTHDGVIRDEYGGTHTADEFFAAVADTDPERRRSQYDWMRTHRPDEVSTAPEEWKTWLDHQGFTFSGRAFS